MRLWLTPEQARTISKHAHETFPLEACGVIGGIGERAHQIVAIPNTADDPRHHFCLDEKKFIETLFGFERNGLTLIGIYHSHPNGDPIPSPIDIQQAAYPDTAYLIVGLRQGEPALAAWSMRGSAVNRAELTIGIEPPETQDTALSHTQKMAIILAAVIAFLFMLLLSLSLLPPAPIIVSPLP
jgi:proteasome lid subunit RPN8/RPN11